MPKLLQLQEKQLLPTMTVGWLGGSDDSGTHLFLVQLFRLAAEIQLEFITVSTETERVSDIRGNVQLKSPNR